MISTPKHISRNGRITQAAPHPRELPLDPKEYYMADQSGEGLVLLAEPGKTHRIVYWLDSAGFEPTIQYEACETMSAVARQLHQHSHQFSAFTPEDVVSQLEKTLEKVRKLTPPKPEAFQGMPYVGDMVWVVAPDKTTVRVKVTEVGDVSGVMSIIFNLHYKPNGEWFWTEEEAGQFAAQNAMAAQAKNIFLGNKS